MRHPSPLRKATHAIPVAALSLLLLSAGMCGQAEEGTPAETAERQAEEQQALEAAPARSAAEAAVAAEEQQRLAAESAAAAERERQLAARELLLREEEERLAAERRLQRERELAAEQQRLAAERAAAAERERQLAAREQELREQEEALARRQDDLAEAETIVIEPAAPEPLPEPTGSYEGDFDEPWRESGATAEVASTDSPAAVEKPPTTTATVRAGEQLEVQIVSPLSSETARKGDRFSTRLVGDLRDATGKVVIPAGAEVIGRVTEAAAYRRGGGPATLAVEFNEIVVSPEQRVGIRASFVELGADKRKNRKKVVAGAVVGAILGHILGGDGSKNVIVGAAAGAAAGGAVVASARDRDAEIPAGQIIALQLEEVVTVEIEYGAVAGR